MPTLHSTALPTVRRALPRDEGDVLRVLTDGFLDDPFSVWMMPDPGRRRRLLPELFRATVRSAFDCGDVWLAGDALGVAVVAPSSCGPTTAELTEASGEYADRALEAFRLMEERHPAEAHRYVPLIATRAGQRGRGVGTVLMNHLLEAPRAHGTADGLAPVYLEATTTASVRFYLRHGFAALGPQLRLPAGPALHPMVYRPCDRPVTRSDEPHDTGVNRPCHPTLIDT